MRSQLIPVWIILILLPCFCIGQLSIHVEPENFVFSGIPSKTDIVYDVDVINTSGQTVSILWSKRLNSSPAEWLSWICTDSLCYAPDVVFCPLSSPKIIAPGDTSIFHLHLNPRNVEGTGEFVVKLVDEDNNLLGITTGNIIISLASSSSEAERNASLSVFPNPATDYFQTSNLPGLKSIEVFTIVGSKIKTMDAAPNKHYPITDLKQGLYLVRLIGSSGQVLKTIRLSVE